MWYATTPSHGVGPGRRESRVRSLDIVIELALLRDSSKSGARYLLRDPISLPVTLSNNRRLSAAAVTCLDLRRLLVDAGDDLVGDAKLHFRLLSKSTTPPSKPPKVSKMHGTTVLPFSNAPWYLAGTAARPPTAGQPIMPRRRSGAVLATDE